MSALSQIPEHYVTQFGTNWDHLVQQKQSRIKSFARLDTITGKEKTYNQMGTTSFNLITTRSGTTNISDIPLAKRWLRPKGYDVATWEDEFDETLLGQIASPTSSIVESMASAYGRLCDSVIISALTGSAYTGEEGTTETVLPSGQKVSVQEKGPGVTPANVGLNLAKLIKAKSILHKNEVDPSDELIIIVSQQQIDDLLNGVTEVKSSDYNAVKALVNGEIDRFMGFKFIRSEQLALNAGTDVRTCVAYAKSGIVLADAGRKVHMDILPSQRHTLQIRTVTRLGASRLEEKKVVEIPCDESP